MNKKPIMLAIILSAFMVAPSVIAETTEKVLLTENFSATEPSLDTKWGKIWISNDYDNYSHIVVVYSSSDAVNGILRVKYGRAESNGAYTITFFNGTYGENHTMKPFLLNSNKKIIESVDVLRPNDFSSVRIRFMNNFFELRSGYSDSVAKIYYQNTNGDIVSINTNFNLSVNEWFRVNFLADKENKTVFFNITDKNNNVLYSRIISDINIENISLGIFADVNAYDEGTYIYFDNFYRAEIVHVENSPTPTPPISENKIIQSGMLGMIIFFALISLLIVSLYMKNLMSLFAVTILSFLIFYFFVFPYSGFFGSINIILSGIATAVISYVKYTTIRDKYNDSIFSKIDPTLIIILVGILVLLLMITMEYGLG